MEIRIALREFSTNIYWHLFIRTTNNFNLRSKPEPKIPSLKNELKSKNSLRYHDSILWNNLLHEIRKLKYLSTFTTKLKNLKPDSCK